MNIVDGACSCCGESTPYTGRLPILCSTCREAREQMIAKGGAAALTSGNTRLLLSDSELVSKPITG